MLLCYVVAQFFYQKISTWRRLFFAAIIILIINPFDIIDASFWLSFMSIFILTWVMSGRLRSPKHLVLWGKMQIAIIIGLLPLMLFFFQQASIVAFFTNAIAIPWIGLLILPMALMATLLFSLHLYLWSHDLFWLTGHCLSRLWKLLEYAAHFSVASWHHAIASLFILILAMMGSIFLLAPRGFPARFLGCFGLIPLFLYHPAYPKMGDYRVTIIDVGRGLSMLVQTAHHVMLYDTGAHFPGGFDYGESVITPYLRFEGIAQIDRLAISDGDNDHSGGTAAIVKNFRVKTIFTSAPKLITQFHAQYCAQGQNWTWDQVHFTTLDDSSCVIKIVGKGGSILLTGDSKLYDTADNGAIIIRFQQVGGVRLSSYKISKATSEI
jgi:competence protein ComEC